MRGAVFMSVSTIGFTSNDAITKTVSESMNSGQMMLVRGLFTVVLIAALAWSNGALRSFAVVARPRIMLRAAGEAGGTIFFLSALAHMPLANVSAILQSLPLAVTVGAAFFLGEPVGWRRWTAIAAGLIGVVIIVRPGSEGFNSFSLFALGTVCCCTVRDLATRGLPREIPTLMVSLATAIAVALCGGALVQPLGGWSPLTLADTAALFAAAVLLIFGYQFIITAMREGDISFIAPFRYMALIWAIALGFLFFGDVPGPAMIIGAAVVIASGIYSLYREQIIARRTPIIKSTVPAMAPDGT